MTMLNQLKSGDIARIVVIHKNTNLKTKIRLKKISAGSIIRIISSFGTITFNSNSKIFSVSNSITENVRVIKIKEQSIRG